MTTETNRGSGKWEIAVVTVPLNADILQALNEAGSEGWEPWCVLQTTKDGVAFGLKRPAQAVLIATPEQAGKLGLLK